MDNILEHTACVTAGKGNAEFISNCCNTQTKMMASHKNQNVLQILQINGGHQGLWDAGSVPWGSETIWGEAEKAWDTWQSSLSLPCGCASAECLEAGWVHGLDALVQSQGSAYAWWCLCFQFHPCPQQKRNLGDNWLFQSPVTKETLFLHRRVFIKQQTK